MNVLCRSFIPEEHIQLAKQELDRLEKNYKYRVEHGRSPLHTHTSQTSFDPYNTCVQPTNVPSISSHTPSVFVPARFPSPSFGEQVLSMDATTSAPLTDQNDLSRFLFQGLMQTQMNQNIQPFPIPPPNHQQQLQNPNQLILQLAQLSQPFGNGNISPAIPQQQMSQPAIALPSNLLASLLNSQQAPK